MVIQNITSFFGFSSNSLPKDFVKLIELLESHQKINQESFDLIYDAYTFGKESHKDQKRRSGKPYFTHCVSVAQILASWGMDQNIIILILGRAKI